MLLPEVQEKPLSSICGQRIGTRTPGVLLSTSKIIHKELTVANGSRSGKVLILYAKTTATMLFGDMNSAICVEVAGGLGLGQGLWFLCKLAQQATSPKSSAQHQSRWVRVGCGLGSGWVKIIRV
eukprot:3039941-Rhodomonas_salina.1